MSDAARVFAANMLVHALAPAPAIARVFACVRVFAPTRVFVVAFALAFVLFSAPPVSAGGAAFTDVETKHWAFDAIDVLSDSGFVSGYPDGTFRPDANVERQEAAAIIANLFNAAAGPAAPEAVSDLSPAVSAAATLATTANAPPAFIDVPEDLWSYESIERASPYLAGKLTPSGVYAFEPDRPATREEIIVALAKFNEYDVHAANLSELSRFSDASQLTVNGKWYVALAIEHGIVSGFADQTLRPRAPVTRAEVCLLLIKALRLNPRYEFAEVSVEQSLFVPEADSGFYDDFFNNSVFVGDSITLGLRTYVLQKRASDGDMPTLGSARFLAEKSYGLTTSANPFNPDWINLTYQGAPKPLESILSEMGVTSVFLMIGTNEHPGRDVSKFINQYNITLNKITAQNPRLKIYVQLNTPIAKAGELPTINNENMDAFIEALKALCVRRGIKWIDTNAPLKGADKGMDPLYSSDAYIHINEAGHAVWVRTLRAFAMSQYEKGLWSSGRLSPEGFAGRDVQVTRRKLVVSPLRTEETIANTSTAD
ncbi:MAG: S-layer homology domain-containing protein [Clostridiales bacterium]|nr:S-layer homology domain-containing protein [Clostridiales bacterium]